MIRYLMINQRWVANGFSCHKGADLLQKVCLIIANDANQQNLVRSFKSYAKVSERYFVFF